MFDLQYTFCAIIGTDYQNYFLELFSIMIIMGLVGFRIFSAKKAASSFHKDLKCKLKKVEDSFHPVQISNFIAQKFCKL